LKLRGGSDAEYIGGESMHTEIGYPHLIRKLKCLRAESATDNGMFFDGYATDGDVVEIVGRA